MHIFIYQCLLILINESCAHEFESEQRELYGFVAWKKVELCIYNYQNIMKWLRNVMREI